MLPLEKHLCSASLRAASQEHAACSLTLTFCSHRVHLNPGRNQARHLPALCAPLQEEGVILRRVVSFQSHVALQEKQVECQVSEAIGYSTEHSTNATKNKKGFLIFTHCASEGRWLKRSRKIPTPNLIYHRHKHIRSAHTKNTEINTV